MSLCLKCALRGRRPNCGDCRSLAPVPARSRVADAARNMVRDFKATDSEILEQRRKAQEYRLREEKREIARVQRRADWRRHDQATKSGKCTITQCPCKEAVK